MLLLVLPAYGEAKLVEANDVAGGGQDLLAKIPSIDEIGGRIGLLLWFIIVDS
jgi:hypothetical protein